MRTACVILTYQAEKSGIWQNVLNSVNEQDYPFDLKLVLDSSSSDRTKETAIHSGWKCLTLKRERFNHGLTRDRIVRILHHRGYAAVVFLSQDIVISGKDSVRKLVDFLLSNNLAGCYGRQLTHDAGSYNEWQRSRTYPDQPEIRGGDCRKGILTTFFSDAFAVWKTEEVIHYGGFEKTDFGEDVLLTAKILSDGGKIGYCAGAVCYHDHSNSLTELFARGRQVGEFHKQHPELLKKHGRAPHGKMRPPVSLLLPFAVKSMGYVWGRFAEHLFPVGVFCLMWFFLIPLILVSGYPKRDIATRYAPMAEAFAAGDWVYAFHPRVPPMLTVCGGILAKIFGCGGVTACQLASSLFLTLAVFPLYYGCKRIYGFSVAALSIVLYCFCSSLIRLGYYGLREAGSVLGIVILFHAASLLFKNEKSLRGYSGFAVGAAVLCLSRGDSVLPAVLALLFLLIWDCYRHLFCFRSAGTVLFFLLLISPQLLYNYRMTGYPVPELRYAVVMQKLSEKYPFFGSLRNPSPQMDLDIDVPSGGESEDDHD